MATEIPPADTPENPFRAERFFSFATYLASDRSRGQSRPDLTPPILRARSFLENGRRLIVNQVSMSAIVVVCQSFKSDILRLSSYRVTPG
jgi:hypothetical protein